MIESDADAPERLVASDWITDEELTAQALAADPDAVADPDAMPWVPPGAAGKSLLPSWYMPSPVTGRRGVWPKVVAAIVILAFVVVNMLGLCIVYGHLTLG
jgi:hypothetical protein